MTKNYKTALILSSILTLSACGGGGSSNNDTNQTTDPNTAVTPDPVTPEPVSPDPVSPDPVSPDPVSPDPVSPDPVSPDPVSPDPVSPDPVSPDPVSPDPVTPVADDDPVTSNLNTVRNQGDAVEFLNRATFGPTKASIDSLVNLGDYEKWIDAQFDANESFHFAKTKRIGELMCADIVGNGFDGPYTSDSKKFRHARHHVWWDTALKGEDQLRQRVALALSEIIVVSGLEGLGLYTEQLAVSGYYDVLVKHAFGNYRELLEEVTLHPVMGDFLSMTRNEKADGAIRPDENYARELLQLFTIGVHELNINGTKKTDANGFIPTYDQPTIEEFAKVFTGWSYANIDWERSSRRGNRFVPLKAFEEFHDTTAKTLLNNEVTSSGQGAQEDLDDALDNIFAHQNIGPYISKQLIQRLVTSNPTPAYVARVARKFNNNGNDVKGDMKAVVKAILLDQEALAENKPANFGKLREPMLRMSHLWRAFNMKASQGRGNCANGGVFPVYEVRTDLADFYEVLGQGPLQAPSVFNFFSPEFSPSGQINDDELVAPEFQIVNENTLVASTNLFNNLIDRFSFDAAFVPAVGKRSAFDLRAATTLANNTTDLLNHLDLVLMNDEMSSALRASLEKHLNDTDAFRAGREGQLQKAREAIILIVASPEYLIQK